MRFAMLAILATLIVAGPVRADSTGQDMAERAGQPLVGQPAPRLPLKTIDGATIDLATLYGKKAVYLKYWATWCVPCREQMPHFERTFEHAGSDLAVIAVNAGFTDTVEDVRATRREFGLRMPITIDDGRLAAAFHFRVTPTHVVIGRDGRVLYVGHLADQRLETALAAARAVPVASIASAADAPSRPAKSELRETLLRAPLATLDGPPFDFRTLPSRVVAVFLSPWCESYLAKSRPAISAQCRQMRERTEALAAEPGFRFIGIASGLWATPADLREYRDQHHVAMPLVLDESGELFRAFGVRNVPTAIVMDAGRVRRILTTQGLAGDAAFRAEVLKP
jgi:peroxiredoxin